LDDALREIDPMIPSADMSQLVGDHRFEDFGSQFRKPGHGNEHDRTNEADDGRLTHSQAGENAPSRVDFQSVPQNSNSLLQQFGKWQQACPNPQRHAESNHQANVEHHDTREPENRNINLDPGSKPGA